MGRKPIPENLKATLKRDERMTVLFTAEEREFIEKQSNEAGHPTVSEFIRKLALKGFSRK